MLRVVTGPFHPHLESALVDHLRGAKADDPIGPIAILVPSSSLLDHLRRLLTLTHGLSLLNVHLLTFHQLALRLADESRPHEPASFPLALVDTLFCEQLVRQVVRRGAQNFGPFEHLAPSSGTWGALWATVRDLNDAALDSDLALRAIEEQCFDHADVPWLRALFSLHASVRAACRTLRIGTPDDLAESLATVAHRSSFLASLRQVIYYGFYDLTQVQLSLFEAVAKQAPTTLYFPMGDHPADVFARRFFERQMLPLATAPGAIVHLDTAGRGSRPPAGDPPVLFVRSVVGAEEELAATCRHIHELVDANGYRFDDIAVAGRTLEPYRPHLQSVFDRYRIPFVSTCARPLIHEPLAKLVLHLADLPRNDGYRGSVLDLVTSPLFRTSGPGRAPAALRPDLWKVIVPFLSITRGRHEWARLERVGRAEWPVGDEEGRASGSPTIASEASRALWEIVSRLLDDCAALPSEGAPAALVAALRDLAMTYLVRGAPAGEGGGELAASLAPVWEGLDSVFESIADLDRMGERMTWAEFACVLTHAIERAAIPFATSRHQGVTVLDAMDARGRSFKAIFVLGLNERVFPRYIREDPFLLDRHRRVLAATLGYKVDEKLSGYDEEALLFSLLCRAATHRLVLSYQRADEQGRPLAPSPYLADAGRALGMAMPAPEAVPRRLSERMTARPAPQSLFSCDELALWRAIHGQDPVPLLEAAGKDGGLYVRGADALERIEEGRSLLSGFDGMTGPLDAVWTRIQSVGLSPTSLERYARCPFQYFCADVLRLEPVSLTVTQELDPRVLGMLCHAALRACYAELIAAGWPEHSVPLERIGAIVQSAVEEAATACEALHHTGHFLLWQLAREQMRSLLADAVEADRAHYMEDGFAPVGFEREAEGVVPLDGLGPASSFAVRGRVDRIDRQRDSGRIRIVDYKFKIGGAMKTEDRRLAQAAVRGTRLQPPLYLRLNFPGYPQPSETQFLFLAPKWTPSISRSALGVDVWSGPFGDRLRRTLALLLDGIRVGRYLMLPDTYCETCDYRVACRRDHTPSWWRAKHSPEAVALSALRRERVDDE